jgi:hypothetical protein
VNTYFATLADLEAVIAQRCIELDWASPAEWRVL